MGRLYALLTTIAALLLLPLLLPLALKAKYRQRLARRLGWGLRRQLRGLPPTKGPTIWLHALSVGEITSALPLVRGLREFLPQARIVVSATTRSGAEVAGKLLAPYADALIAAPLDIGPVVPLFLRIIRPTLFLQVETDFWPHWLRCLADRQIPSMLVNGRISAASFARYRRTALLMRPMFRCFTLLAMQTAGDAANMASLGVAREKIRTLGNLKFDTSQAGGRQSTAEEVASLKIRYGYAADAPLWICGSTHRGEEEQVFAAYRELCRHLPNLQLLVAPRQIERAGDIAALGHSLDLPCRQWSRDRTRQGPVLLLDTIGELAGCYAMAEAVLVGGSLVAAGGHNPLEAAVVGVPVLFGPHMEDFSEIAQALIACGGARRVDGAEALAQTLLDLLTDTQAHQAMARAGLQYIEANRGVVRRHLEAITALLPTQTTG